MHGTLTENYMLMTILGQFVSDSWVSCYSYRSCKVWIYVWIYGFHEENVQNRSIISHLITTILSHQQRAVVTHGVIGCVCMHVQCESKKSPPAVFWHFSQTVGNF